MAPKNQAGGGTSRGLGHGDEVEPEVQTEDDEDESEQDASDSGDDTVTGRVASGLLFGFLSADALAKAEGESLGEVKEQGFRAFDGPPVMVRSCRRSR